MKYVSQRSIESLTAGAGRCLLPTAGPSRKSHTIPLANRGAKARDWKPRRPVPRLDAIADFRFVKKPPATLLPRKGTVASFDWSKLQSDFARRDLLPAIPTALLCWFLTILFSVSLATLIFRGPLLSSLPLGIGMSLGTAVVVGLVTIFSSSIPAAIAIPNDRTAPMLAILAASIAAGFSASSPDMVPTCLAALIFATGLNGIILWLLGHFRMGILVRFLPYPVVGGFMAGAGWLLVKGAMTVATGFELTLDNAAQFFAADTFLRWAPSMALALTMLIATRLIRHFLVIPTIAAAGVVLFYGLSWCAGFDMPHLRAIGWLPAPFPTAVTWHPLALSLVTTMKWALLATHAATFATIVMVSAISILMISSSVELTARLEVDADRELRSAGLANCASFLTGGLIGFHSLSLTTLSLRIGPNSRWVGLFTVIGTALTLAFAPNLVSYLPVPLLGALLLYLGMNFLAEWLFDSYRKMRRTDYLIIWLILIVVAWAGYLIGVGVGLMMALALFALRYSLIDVVRLELNGAQHRSNVDRTAEEVALLRPVRPTIHILKLQGFIFFGTAYSLLHRVRSRAHNADLPPLRYLVLDFRHVTGVDSSAMLSLGKLLHIGEQSEFATLCTGVPLSVLKTLKRDAVVGDGFAFQPDIDHAVEWCESRELLAQKAPVEPPPVDICDALERALPGRPEVTKKLATYFVAQDIAATIVLTVQGDTSRDLFLIQKGRISALLKAKNGEVIRLRTMGPGSIVGELAMYLGRPRTASLIAETDSIVWRLSLDTLAEMESSDPRSASALHEILARMLSGRLAQANDLLEISLR
jgi:SulP family sulfate permease